MAYITGNAANPDALLQAVKEFLETNGWTINRWSDVNHYYGTLRSGFSALGKQLCIQKTNSYGENMFFNFRSCNRVVPLENGDNGAGLYGGYYPGECSGIAMNASTGYDGGSQWDKQPGFVSRNDDAAVSVGACIADVFSSCNYWINSVGDSVILVVEYSADNFQELVFGTMKKQGVMAGSGIFFVGSCYSTWPHYSVYSGYNQVFGGTSTARANGAMRVSGIDGFTRWTPMNAGDWDVYDGVNIAQLVRGTGTSPRDVHSNNSYLLGFLLLGSPNNYSNVTPMMPIYHILARTVTNKWSIVGYPEGICYINMQALNAKAEFTLGADTWKCFPISKKTGNTWTEGVPGFAIKIS